MNLHVSPEDFEDAIREARRGGQEARCICVIVILALLLSANAAYDSKLEEMYEALPGSDRLLVKDALRTLLREEAD